MPADAITGDTRRSLIVPVVTMAIIVGILLSLGFWQLQRKTEKRLLIATLNERLAAPPSRIPPATWVHLTAPRDEFRRVTFSATIDTSKQAQVYSSGSALRKDVPRNGVWVFAPARLDDGTTIVINRGFVPEGQAAPSGANENETFTGYIRFPEQAGWLTPQADVSKHLWFLRDHRNMATTLGWPNAASTNPYYIDLEGPVPPGGLPKPGPLTVNLKDDHLQYAITWFLLAAAVSIAFLVWLQGQKRLKAV